MKIFKKNKAGQVQEIPESFDDGIPMNRGNTYQIKKELESQNEINNATLSYKALSKVENYFSRKFKKEQYDIWRLLNFQADYYCNIFPIETSNGTLNQAIQIAKRTAFIYGMSGIYKLGTTFIPIYFVEKKFNNDGTINKCKIASAVQIMGQQAQTPNVKNMWTMELNEIDIVDNLAILKWDTLSMGAWWKFLPFIEQWKRLLTMLNIEGYSLTKKFSLKAVDTSVITKELDIFFNHEIPFTIEHRLQGDISNKIELNELSKSNAETTPFLSYYTFWEQTWYKILGRRYNADFKKERNITSEVDATQNTFDILESDVFIHHKIFVDKLKNITSMEIEIRNEPKDDQGNENDI